MVRGSDIDNLCSKGLKARSKGHFYNNMQILNKIKITRWIKRHDVIYGRHFGAVLINLFSTCIECLCFPRHIHEVKKWLLSLHYALNKP